MDQVLEMAGLLEVCPARKGGKVLESQEQLVGAGEAVILFQENQALFRLASEPG